MERTFLLKTDVDFIVKQAGVINFMKTRLDNSWLLRYDDVDDAAIAQAIDEYQTSYVAVMLPKVVEDIRLKREAYVMGFTFGGMPIPLDPTTQANISGSATGLTRNPSVAYIDWHMGNGVFTRLPRDLILMMADAAFARVQTAFSKHKTLCDAARACQTVAELEALDLTSIWSN